MRSLLCALILSAGTGLAAAEIASSSDTASGVDAVNRAWIDAYVAGDVDALVSLYAPDAAILSTGGVILEGHDAVRQFFDLVMNTRSRNIVVRDSAVREYGDIVIQNMTWNYEALLDDGSSLEGRGRSALVFRKTSEGWQIIGYHPAFDRPPLW